MSQTASRTVCRSRSLQALAALLLLLAAAPALAQDTLAEAKAAGWVGERVDGYVGLVRSEAPASVQELVQRVNSERTARYEEIARRNGTTPVVVAALAGRKLIERTPSGQFVNDESGNWVRKP